MNMSLTLGFGSIDSLQQTTSIQHRIVSYVSDNYLSLGPFRKTLNYILKFLVKKTKWSQFMKFLLVSVNNDNGISDTIFYVKISGVFIPPF